MGRDATPRKIDIRPPQEARKGLSLPLKAPYGGDRLEPSVQQPGKFVFQGPSERIKAVAIKRGDKIASAPGITTHKALRKIMDPANLLGIPTFGDIEGYLTTQDRFVTREEGAKLALECGQIKPEAYQAIVEDEKAW